MKTIYQADDGTTFDDRDDCILHEFMGSAVKMIHAKYPTATASMATFAAVVVFELRDEIAQLLPTDKKESNWISIDGHMDNYHPDKLTDDQLIVVKLRSGAFNAGRADTWESAWRSSDNCSQDIIAYQRIKE